MGACELVPLEVCLCVCVQKAKGADCCCSPRLLLRYLSLEPGVFPLMTILEFGSDKSEEVDVSAIGLATLLGNAACGAASLRTAARAGCAAPGSAAEDIMEVYGNLDPLELDVDFGQEVGPPAHPSAPCSAAVQVCSLPPRNPF